MKRFLKLVLFVFATSAFTLSAQAAEPAPAPAKTMEKPMKKPSGKGFYHELLHANFMPNLMPKLLRSYKHGNPLKLTKEQYEKLAKFHKEHLPNMKAMIKNVMHLEAEARNMALAGKDDKDIIKVGEESLKVRSDIMNGKLKCRAFVRSVLTPEQFTMLADNFHHPKKMMPKPAPAAKAS